LAWFTLARSYRRRRRNNNNSPSRTKESATTGCTRRANRAVAAVQETVISTERASRCCPRCRRSTMRCAVTWDW
jgi:hypothetical protein